MKIRSSATRAGTSFGVALLVLLFAARSLQNAVAEGETRSITMHHLHTGEDITITYKREGRYDEAALAKLNWFLRDWRRSEQTTMDPRLIDLVWEVQREAGSGAPIDVVCGYRSPQTNAMLRHRSGGVARYSQHMLGRAMDFYIPGIPLEKLREIGLRLQRGGVGFYPESGSPFVHMDVADVRMWPRMTRDQLARVFPDGRTVQIPTDGKPLSGYAVALAEIQKRGGMPSANSLDAARNAGVAVGTMVASNDRPPRNPFARLLGLSKDGDEEDDSAAATPAAKPVAVASVTPAAGAKIPQVKGAVAAKVASAIAKLPVVHIAKILPGAAHSPAAAPAAPSIQTVAAAGPLSPNDIILARGYWAGPPDAAPAVNPLSTLAGRSVADATGSIMPVDDEGAATPLALAFADASGTSDATAQGIAALRAAALAAHPNLTAETTGAVRRTADHVVSAVMTASASTLTVIRSGAHLANPWLRAMVLSPSVRSFLTTVALGDRDFRSLAALMVKPKSAVRMTFGVDPNSTLSTDRFSGAAIVFVSTVDYPAPAPTHTAQR